MTATNSSLRIAVLGCGSVAQAVHLPLLARDPRVHVVAIADGDAQRLAQGARLAPGAARFSSADAALRDVDALDAVMVSLPTAALAATSLAALDAGRHVYVEKPAGTQPSDVAMLGAAARRAGLVVQVGYNYRFNPLYRALGAALDAGRAGALVCVRTVFATAPAQLPAWKQTRGAGAGVLPDLASHHIDLLRFLLRREVRRVHARMWDTRAPDDSALLELEFDGGLAAQCFMSLSATAEDRIDVYGRDGQLTVERSRSSDVTFTPAGGANGPAASARAIAGAAAGMPYRLRKLREPWHEPSYRVALDHFVSAVRDSRARDSRGRDHRAAHPDVPTTLDADAVLRVLAAAYESAESGRTVDVQRADDTATGAPVDTVAMAGSDASLASVRPPAAMPITNSPFPHAANDRMPTHPPDTPALTVVLITPDRYETVRTTVQHVLAQTARDRIELLLFAPSAATLDADAAELAAFRWVRVIEMGAVDVSGRLRARAVREASAPVVVFGEDHCYPDPEWAEALLGAYAHGHAAVGPVVRNANPVNAVSWADFLIGYGPWAGPRRGGAVDFLPGHNSSYRRDAVLPYGDRLDELMDAETVLQWDLRAQGHTLHLEPRATTAHVNFARMEIWLPVNMHHGRVFGGTRSATWSRGKRVAWTLAAPLIPLVRFARALRQGREAGLTVPFLARIAPTLFAGLVADGIGQMIGYAAGTGGAREKLVVCEYHRDRVNRVPGTTPLASSA